MLEHNDLLTQLHYDAETGVFTRLVSNSNRVKVGDVAGYMRHDGYVVIRVNRTTYLAHRLAYFYMNGVWPDCEVDHINGQPSDNRWRNLRSATVSQNRRNSRKHHSSFASYKGITFDKARGLWAAVIYYDGKNHHLGRYLTAEEAAEAYRARAKELHGEFYRAA